MRVAARVLAFLLLFAARVFAAPHGSPTAEEAVRICSDGDEMTPDAQRRAFEHGLQLAEQAAARDPTDAAAHFGIVCNLGKKMRLRGASLLNLFSLRRLRRAIDRTLELAPNDADTLSARGALLLNLPRMLGGDKQEAARIFRRVLEIDPHHAEALRYLPEAAKH